MKTWRERIVAARRRGRFLKSERVLSQDLGRCAAGEAASHNGLPSYLVCLESDHPATELWDLGDSFSEAVAFNEMARAEKFLDLIEDRALELKRLSR